MTEYRFVGGHPESLEGGHTLAPGDFLTVTEKDETTSRLIEEGKLVEARKGATKKAADAGGDTKTPEEVKA